MRRNIEIDQYTNKMKVYEQSLYEANTIINELKIQISKASS
jgi:hypothetical protein